MFVNQWLESPTLPAMLSFPCGLQWLETLSSPRHFVSCPQKEPQVLWPGNPLRYAWSFPVLSWVLTECKLISIRTDNDPLLSVFGPLGAGKIVSVTTTSAILITSIPHLYNLANFPIIIHTSLHPIGRPDFSEIAALRQCGFALLQSETLQEAQDMAISAHALAFKTGKGIIHFFDTSNLEKDESISPEDKGLVTAILQPEGSRAYRERAEDEIRIHVDDASRPLIVSNGVQTRGGATSHDLQDRSQLDVTPTKSPPLEHSSVGSSVRESSADSRPTISSVTSAESTMVHEVSSNDVLDTLDDIWKRMAEITGREYRAFEYTGPEDAESVIFIFGSTGHFVDSIREPEAASEFARCGIITARLYRPWSTSRLMSSLPPTVLRIAVIEQLRSRTTKWGPVFADVVLRLKNRIESFQSTTVVSCHLGRVEASTARQALRGILQNLNSSQPIQNLEFGHAQSAHGDWLETESNQPRIENAYMKILHQVFGSGLYVANHSDVTDAGISSSVSTIPEFSFGGLLARIDRRHVLMEKVRAIPDAAQFATQTPQEWLTKWILNAQDKHITNQIASELLVRLATDGSLLANELLADKEFFFTESQWLIGSDAWAYDVGNSGVHHVLASGANVNMLIIDSQPWSDKVANNAARRKKDIGLYAMNFGNAYVASVAVYSSYTQVLEAMIEADQFEGPSVILAYLPSYTEEESPLTILQETKKAVDLGYWPLYRWNPRNEENGLPNFILDSERIKAELQEFLRRDNHLTQLMKRSPRFAVGLSESYEFEVRALQQRKAKDAYVRMIENLDGAPMTVLFASDNGNAESLAKRLGARGRVRGLKTVVMAMDDYPLDDLPTEENMVLITSTAGQGEFPQNGRSFWESVRTNGDLDLSNVHFSVFALGDSHYWPRKEDKIYYNKSGKDLDSRVAFLGAQRLTNIGLGDDQDPDGYQTGYAEWEPKLWQSLDVDEVGGLPEEPPTVTNEDIKSQSNYLRGTIPEGLEDTTTGAIAASDQQLTKFHGTYMQDDRDLRDERKAQGLEPAYAFMIRCRLNGGVATSSQWLQMDSISTKFGNGTMKLTTRQTFQFHGVIKTKLKSAMRGINKALMTTIAACGDVNRNVMCSVLPTKSAFHGDVHQISVKISDHLLPSTTAYHEIWLQEDKEKKIKVAGDALVDHEPLYGPTYLPRKFKITIAVPPHNDTDVYAHDIGLIAIKNREGRLAGFNMLVGGGMGVTHNNKKTYPRTGSMMGYIPADEAHVACEKVMVVQRDHGDRKNRKHARLKYTIDDMGIEVFRQKVEDLLGHSFGDPRPFQFRSNIDTFGWQKDEFGKNHFTFFIENGRIEDTAEHPFKTGLREIAKIHKGEFRLTGNQHLCLSGVDDEDLEHIKSMMAQYKLENLQFSGLRLSSSACVAFPTCGLAMAESERYLPELITKLEECLEKNGMRHDSIVMRMTGCPNGCARPWLAEVAFVGKAYGTYNMYLGGGYHGERLNKLYRSSIGEEEILDIMKPMLRKYALERHEDEHFGDWTIRSKIINETAEGKYFHENTAEEQSEAET